jgi:drug/metabolite transporter (DMT)-like permease
MPTGPIFALIAAITWAFNAVLVRNISARTGESISAATVSVFVGVPVFAAVLSIAGEWNALAHISARAYALLATGGVVQLVGGRLLVYTSIRRIGTNKSGPLVATTPVFVVVLSILWLHEPLTASLAVGIAGIVAGAILISSEKKIAGEGVRISGRKTEIQGIAAAIGGAVLLGVSTVMVKSALNEINSPFISIFVFYIAAAVVMALFLTNDKHKKGLAGGSFPWVFWALIGAGLLASGSQLSFYIAMSMSPASLVSPLLSTNVLLVFLISFVFIRRLELFTLKVFLGIVAIIIGAFFIFQ